MAGSVRSGPTTGDQEFLIEAYNAMTNIIPDSRAIDVLQDLILKGLPPVKALDYMPWVPNARTKWQWKKAASHMAYQIVTLTDVADYSGWDRWGHIDGGGLTILKRDGRFSLHDSKKPSGARTISVAPIGMGDKNEAIIWFRKHANVSFMAFTPEEVRSALKARMAAMDHRVSLLMRSWNGEWKKLSPGHAAVQDWINAYLRPMLDGRVTLSECCIKHGTQEVRNRYEAQATDGISDCDFQTMLEKGEE